MNRRIYKEATDNLINHVKQISGLDPFKNTRKREYIEIRAIIAHYLRNDLGMTYNGIVEVMNDHGANIKTHVRILHALKNYDIYLRFSPLMRDWADALKRANLGKKYERAVKLRNKIFELNDDQIEHYYEEISDIIRLKQAKEMEVVEPEIVDNV